MRLFLISRVLGQARSEKRKQILKNISRALSTWSVSSKLRDRKKDSDCATVYIVAAQEAPFTEHTAQF